MYSKQFLKLRLTVFFVVSSYLLMAQTNLRRVFQHDDSYSTIPYGANIQAGKFALSKDANIYYETYGKGKPIILLHGGILGSTIEMASFINLLKDTHLVIAISSRGHGKSEVGTEPITFEQKALDILAVMNAMSLKESMILGFSDGAYAGLKLASMYPDRVTRLVAIGAGELIPGLRKVRFEPSEILKMDEKYWAQQLSLSPQPEKIARFWINQADLYNSITVSKNLFQSISCPVLLIAGENDRNAPLETILHAYHMIPTCQLGIIPNAGHGVFIDNFKATWALIEPFIYSNN